MPQTLKEQRQSRIERFMRALQNYIRSEISEATREDGDGDSMGSFHEEKELEEALEDIIP